MTYPFRKQPVTRAQTATVAETDAPAWDASFVLDNYVLLVVADEFLEPLHELRISANERPGAVHEDCAIDEVLAEEVAELEELVESVFVADGLFRAIEEAQFLACRGTRCRRRDRRWQSWDERGRRRWLIGLLRHGVCLLNALL